MLYLNFLLLSILITQTQIDTRNSCNFLYNNTNVLNEYIITIEYCI